MFPFAQTGGAGESAYALSQELSKKGLDVSVLMPLYPTIDEQKIKFKTHIHAFSMRIHDEIIPCDVYRLLLDQTTVYFFDMPTVFVKTMYGKTKFDHEKRFVLFNHAVLQALPLLGTAPDIIQCMGDGCTAWIPYLLKTQYTESFYQHIKTIYLIQNLIYRADCDLDMIPYINAKRIPSALQLDSKTISGGYLSCLFADHVATVSQNYAHEISEMSHITTHKKIQAALHVRKYQKEIRGIHNGIHFHLNSPAQNPYIKNYDIDSLETKAKIKMSVQEKYGLEVNPEIPMIAILSRISGEKAIKEIYSFIGPYLENQNAQLVICGNGVDSLVERSKELMAEYPNHIVYRPFDFETSYQFYAAADMAMTASFIEPCGLLPMTASRFGTIPIASKMGGLKDSVKDVREHPIFGNGYVMPWVWMDAIEATLDDAIFDYRNNKDSWRDTMVRGMLMASTWTWERAAKQYIEMFHVVKRKNVYDIPEMIQLVTQLCVDPNFSIDHHRKLSQSKPVK